MTGRVKNLLYSRTHFSEESELKLFDFFKF